MNHFIKTTFVASASSKNCYRCNTLGFWWKATPDGGGARASKLGTRDTRAKASNAAETLATVEVSGVLPRHSGTHVLEGRWRARGVGVPGGAQVLAPAPRRSSARAHIKTVFVQFISLFYSPAAHPAAVAPAPKTCPVDTESKHELLPLHKSVLPFEFADVLRLSNAPRISEVPANPVVIKPTHKRQSYTASLIDLSVQLERVPTATQASAPAAPPRRSSLRNQRDALIAEFFFLLPAVKTNPAARPAAPAKSPLRQTMSVLTAVRVETVASGLADA